MNKTQAAKLWLVVVLHLIGWEIGASFRAQSQSEAKKQQQQTNKQTTTSILNYFQYSIENCSNRLTV